MRATLEWQALRGGYRLVFYTQRRFPPRGSIIFFATATPQGRAARPAGEALDTAGAWPHIPHTNSNGMRTMAEELAKTARAVFEAGVRAADPADAVRRALADRAEAIAGAGRIHLIAAGKAAVPMMRAALDVLPRSRIAVALAVTNDENLADIAGANRPRRRAPPARSPRGTGGRGGGSHCRACRRRRTRHLPHLGRCLGHAARAGAGRVARGKDRHQRSPPSLRRGHRRHEHRPQGPLAPQGRGPGPRHRPRPRPLAHPLGCAGRRPGHDCLGAHRDRTGHPRSRVRHRPGLGLLDRLPASVAAHLAARPTPPSTSPDIENVLIGSNRLSLRAMEGAAAEAGFQVEVLSEWLEGDVEEAARAFASAARTAPRAGLPCLRAGKPACM